jgi:hypothetical protein
MIARFWIDLIDDSSMFDARSTIDYNIISYPRRFWCGTDKVTNEKMRTRARRAATLQDLQDTVGYSRLQ